MNRGNDRKVGVNSPIGNANKSFASTSYTQNQQGQGQRTQQAAQRNDFIEGDYGQSRNYGQNRNDSQLRANKS